MFVRDEHISVESLIGRRQASGLNENKLKGEKKSRTKLYMLIYIGCISLYVQGGPKKTIPKLIKMNFFGTNYRV